MEANVRDSFFFFWDFMPSWIDEQMEAHKVNKVRCETAVLANPIVFQFYEESISLQGLSKSKVLHIFL